MAWPDSGLMDSLNRIIWQVCFFSVFCLTASRPVSEKVGISLSGCSSFVGICYSLAILLGLRVREETGEISRREGVCYRKC